MIDVPNLIIGILVGVMISRLAIKALRLRRAGTEATDASERDDPASIQKHFR